MAEIIKIEYKGDDFNNLHKYEVELSDNGETVIGNIYKKNKDPYFKEGDEVEYTINDKGTLKLNKPGQESFNSTANIKYNTSYGKKDEKTEIKITRTAALKIAAIYFSAKNVSENMLFDLSRKIEKEINRTEDYPTTDTLKDDQPF